MSFSYLFRNGKVNEIMSTSSDKRTVATDALEFMGKVIPPDKEVGRDAVHLACEPVTCGAYSLKPGQRVGFLDDGTVGYGSNTKLVGIVDPFLKKNVNQGERFLLIVDPGTITSLRHVWTHPDFPEDDCVIDSHKWLKGFAVNLGIEYNALLSRADEYVKYGDCWNGGSEFEGKWIPDEFWDHYEKVTGFTINDVDRGNFLSCSC